MISAATADPPNGIPPDSPEEWAQHLLAGRDPAEAWPPPISPGTDFELARVIEVIPETPDVVTLRLRRDRNETFAPGQHFHVALPIGRSWPAVEAYSVASSPWPDPQTIDLTVKEIPGGRVSPILARRIPVGATLAIEGPRGYFTWTETEGGPLALVCAGSGIVPLMSIVRYAVAKGLQVPTRVLYSSKDRAHSIYFRELARLADVHSWLEVIHVFTADDSDPAAPHHRRIDQDILSEVFADIAGRCLAYVCGPFSLVTEAEAALTAIGVTPDRLLRDQWE